MLTCSPSCSSLKLISSIIESSLCYHFKVFFLFSPLERAKRVKRTSCSRSETRVLQLEVDLIDYRNPLLAILFRLSLVCILIWYCSSRYLDMIFVSNLTLTGSSDFKIIPLRMALYVNRRGDSLSATRSTLFVLIRVVSSPINFNWKSKASSLERDLSKSTAMSTSLRQLASPRTVEPKR